MDTWLVEVRDDNVWIHACSCSSWQAAVVARKFLAIGPVRMFEIQLSRAFTFNTLAELESEVKKWVG